MGDALLPVARTLTEDKAGWGLVPGLQPPATHIHTALRRRPPARPPALWRLLLLLAGLRRAGLELAASRSSSVRGSHCLPSEPRSEVKDAFSTLLLSS